MEVVNTILHPIFAIAVRDGIIRQNPASGIMAELKRSYQWDVPKRHALTESEQFNFIEYVKNRTQYRHWLPLFTVLLGTGCRVGEIIGLRWQDCNFNENIITIDHNLTYRQQEDCSGCKFCISKPKTKSGVRIIPMFKAVKESLLDEYNRQSLTGFNQSVVQGFSGFIFQNRYGNIVNPASINRAIARIVRDYNKEETEKANAEHRSPALLSNFSVHSLRHTFCTRLCENEPNIKVIQEIMGHADISTTMEVYNEASKEKKLESFANLEEKIKIN